MLVPAVARRLGRPVKWVETRHEHFLSAAADRDQAHEARLGVTREGRIVALETTFTRDHGVAPVLGEAITLNTINHLPGPYRVPNYRGSGRNVLTHKTFAAAYRGAGRPEAAFVLDRLLDRAARALAMNSQYDAWMKSGHRHVAGCVDCHLPHHGLAKWVAKSEHGFRHSMAFTLQNFKEPIEITPKDRLIVQANCVRCHDAFVHAVFLSPGPAGEELRCMSHLP